MSRHEYYDDDDEATNYYELDEKDSKVVVIKELDLSTLYPQHPNDVKNGSKYIIIGKPGCHQGGTKVVMYNGTIKNVEDVEVGDVLMGDDSTPRNVLELCRGYDDLYSVIPTKGDPYVVNKDHILSLKCTGYNSIKKGTIEDIKLTDYLKKDVTWKLRFKGFRSSINFTEKEVDIHPWMVGYWLGDGTSTSAQITTADSEVVEAFDTYLYNLDLELNKSVAKYRYNIRCVDKKSKNNQFLNFLRENNLIKNKHIPLDYKANSREVRLNVLAGLIDSDGHYDVKSNGYDIIQKSEILMDDILYIARSLGFSAYKKKCNKSCMYNGEKRTGTYYRCFISGDVDQIPCIVDRKKAKPRNQIKDVTVTGIKVQYKEKGNYYGFVLDGNHRYILSDFTVTHNTGKSTLIKAILYSKKHIFPTGKVHSGTEDSNGFFGEIMPSTFIENGLDLANLTSIEDFKKRQKYAKQYLESRGDYPWSYLIIDDCFVAGTPISLSCGTSVPIEQLHNYIDRSVLAHREDGGDGLYNAKITNYIKKGKKKCVEVTFEDGRRIRCTPDHKFLTTDNKWVSIKDIDSLKVKSGMVYAKTTSDLDDSWSIVVNDIEFNCKTFEQKNKTLSLARLLGVIITDGSIYFSTRDDRYHSKVYVSHQMDAQSIVKDIHTIIGGDMISYKRYKNNYIVRIPNRLVDILIDIKGVTLGRRIESEFLLPQFILEDGCPIDVVREFLGGMFGGDGVAPVLLTKTQVFDGLGLVQSKSVDRIQSLIDGMKSISYLLDKLGIKSTVSTPTTNTKYSGAKKVCCKLKIPTHQYVSFTENVGFRYSSHKSQRLSAAYSYYYLKYRVIDELTRTGSSSLHPTSVLRGKKLLNFYNTEEYLRKIDALKFFKQYKKSEHFPTFSLGVHSIVDIGEQEVFDISVEDPYHSFLANGMVAHNCSSDNKLFKKPIFQELYKNGRHWRMMHLLSLQYSLDIPPPIRVCIDGVFILRESNPGMRKKLYENYGSCVESFAEWNDLMDQLTDNYTAMFINNKTTSNNLEDIIFFIKADPNAIPKDWKVGCREFWDFHYDRYDPNYVGTS